MKVAIAYYSQHHGNTKKLLNAIAEKHEVTLIDVTKKQEYDLRDFDVIGFASGVYYGKLAKQLVSFAQINLSDGKDIFTIYTFGGNGKDVDTELIQVADKRHCKNVGSYHCYGFDTYGPFKLVGGIKKGHPTQKEISGAVKFFDALYNNSLSQQG